MGAKRDNTWLIMLLLVIIFFALNYEAFVLNYHINAGDYSFIHFTNSFFIDAFHNDFEIPIWLPYQDFGSASLFSLIIYNPIIVLLSLIVIIIGVPFNLSSHSGFQITYFAYITFFISTFGFGCYWLAREVIQNKRVQVICFAMAIFGTHIYMGFGQAVYTLNFIPYVLVFLVRLLKGDGIKHYANSIGFILSFFLLFATVNGFLNHLINFVIIVFICVLISTNKISELFFYLAKRIIKPTTWNFKKIIIISLVIIVGGLSLLSLKIIAFERMSEFSNIDKRGYTRSEFLVESTFFKNSFHPYSVIENLINYKYFDKKLSTWDTMKLYYGLLPLMILLLAWRHIRNRFFYFFGLSTFFLFLISTSSAYYNFITPVLCYLNPFYTSGTRHANIALTFAAPFLIIVFGLAIEKYLEMLHNNNDDFLQYRKLIIFCCIAGITCLFVMNTVFFKNANYYFIIKLTIIMICLFFLTYLPFKNRLRTNLLVIVITIELLIPFYGFLYERFEPISQIEQNKYIHLIKKLYNYRGFPSRYRIGQNIPGPKFRGFPIPYSHHFSYWFDDKNYIVTTRNYPELHNAAFKFFFNIPS